MSNRHKKKMYWNMDENGYQVPDYATSPTTGFFKSHRHEALEPVIIGGRPIYLGARMDISAAATGQMNMIVTLNGDLPDGPVGHVANLLFCELPDRGGVPSNWKAIVDYIANLMKREDYKILAYCTGGHGRTGTLGASLIAVMEPDVEDPIAAIRERHCEKAVESAAQAKAIFELKGVEAPEEYTKIKSVVYQGSSTYQGNGFTNNYATESSANQSMIPDNPIAAAAIKKAHKDNVIHGWNMPQGFKGNVRIWTTGKPGDDVYVPQDRVLAFLTALRNKTAVPTPRPEGAFSWGMTDKPKDDNTQDMQA